MVRKFRVVVNGKEYIVEVEELESSQKTSNGSKTILSLSREVPSVSSDLKEKSQETVEKEIVEKEKSSISSAEEKLVKAPMAGIVLKVLVKEGQEVKVGDKLLIFEAMKMENELQSEFSGVVKEIFVKEGDNIETGQILLKIV
ncbi:biotin/lipoyl-containing protein [Thermotoga sp. KOL6]|uniref:biotin/lipoyl-containing protein n=1 Tax=Thermotoga sp. KOL6 TaxID=126741 RepID=UPI000C75795D|nr:biotin/lipoyl-containing protein [Thermotoga sp. KOL6]PLV59417.1 acetyl-CoA carboxylase biotin carboxyl carrier protein subunit [Thermotoga sp. KOL6]